MPTPFLQCRCSSELRDRADKAAEECGLQTGTWLRMVVENAVEAHFDVEHVPSSNGSAVYEVRRAAGLCTCPGFVHRGTCKHLDPDVGEPVELPDEYAERVATEAAALRADARNEIPRVEHPVDALPADVVVEHPDASIVVEKEEERSEKLSQRDCPHLPQWRVGSRCRCGKTLGARMGRR